MSEPEYEIWVIDDELPAIPVFMADCFSYEEAIEIRGEYQSHSITAWIQDRDTGEIIK